MDFLDLAGANLPEWESPEEAAIASVDSMMRLQAMLIATRLLLQRMHYTAENRLTEKKLERELDDTKATGFMLSGLLNAARHQ